MKKLILLFSIMYLASCSNTNLISESKLDRRINSVSGNPGASPSILIRGISSINASTEPLIILDGMRYSGPLSMINPNDIESVEVLKNPSETSIYGIQGANGVIVIKTKKGGKK